MSKGTDAQPNLGGAKDYQLPKWNPDYDPTSPEEQAKVKDFMDSHEHQYQCAVCGKNLNPTPLPVKEDK